MVVVWLIIFIPLSFVFLGKLLSWKVKYSVVDTNQKSAYECGFSPFQSARQPFSIYFFLLALLFLLFDLELVILSPLPLVWELGLVFWGVFVFLVILLVGLFHEWREGSLEWSEK